MRLKFKVGERVRTLYQITEGGDEGDPNADRLDGAFIHAEPGETGVIETIRDATFEDGFAIDVVFDRTGTVSVVAPFEIQHVDEQPN